MLFDLQLDASVVPIGLKNIESPLQLELNMVNVNLVLAHSLVKFVGCLLLLVLKLDVLEVELVFQFGFVRH